VTPGSIVSYRNFKFHDGGEADKLLVILNAGNKMPYLVLKTTSRQNKWRLPKEGCDAPRGYYFLPAKRDNFPKDTWVLFEEVYQLDAAQFLKAHFGGDALVRGTLKVETLRAIINCAKKSDDWSESYNDLLN
jgi:hypothetical protein